MTNAIEQSKREMYQRIADIRKCAQPRGNASQEYDYLVSDRIVGVMEEALESYLELLRQDHEALHETARKRFEDIQGLLAENEKLSESVGSMNKTVQTCAMHSLNRISDLEEKLAKMTEERDLLLNRQQASGAAHATYSEKGATVHQSSVENVSCAKLDGNAAAILGALLDAQSVMVEYLVPDGIRAKDAIGKMIPILDNEKLYVAMRGFEHPNGGYAAWLLKNDKCMHSFPSGEQCVFCGVGK